MFLENGYIVGQIGTEPSSQLFGMDYVYPMGFNNSVYIDSHDSVRYINECINRLCPKNCDIIITGSQTSVLPFDVANVGMFPLKQFVFLMGSQPDAVVMCVNPYDDLSYIRRSIGFIESSVDCKVIALVVYPMNIKNDWTMMYNQKEVLSDVDYRNLKNALGGEFSMPVYRLGEHGDTVSLYNDIIHFFEN